MAVHLSIGRIPSILLLALLGPAVAAGSAYYLSRSEPETAPASQITATVPLVTPRSETKPTELPLAAVAEAEVALAPAAEDEAALEVDVDGEAALVPEAEDETALEVNAEGETALAPEAVDEVALEANVEDEDAIEPEFEAVIVVAVAPEAAPAVDAFPIVPARPVANAGQSESGPAVAPAAAPAVAPVPVTPSVAAPVAAPVAPPVAPAAAAAQGRVTVARLVVERPQVSPVPRDPAVSILRPKNMAPIPRRAPRAAMAGSHTAHSAVALFQSGTAIRVKKDASVYITTRNIPENDRLLEAYSAEWPGGGQLQTRLGEATAVPGLLGIAAQTQRRQGGGQDAPAYSLADAMRDAIWRKNTAARLKSLTTAQNACAEGTGDIVRNAPSIGLAPRC
jgi:hypothetical protein